MYEIEIACFLVMASLHLNTAKSVDVSGGIRTTREPSDMLMRDTGHVGRDYFLKWKSNPGRWIENTEHCRRGTSIKVVAYQHQF